MKTKELKSVIDAVQNGDMEWGVGICAATNELVSEGFYLQMDGTYYLNEKDLIAKLRTLGNGSDQELLEKWYDSECNNDQGFYFSEWSDDEDNIEYVKINNEIYRVI